MSDPFSSQLCYFTWVYYLPKNFWKNHQKLPTLATAFAKSLVLSVFPVPAGPAGAQPMHKCKAWRIRTSWMLKTGGCFKRENWCFNRSTSGSFGKTHINESWTFIDHVSHKESYEWCKKLNVTCKTVTIFDVWRRMNVYEEIMDDLSCPSRDL